MWLATVKVPDTGAQRTVAARRVEAGASADEPSATLDLDVLRADGRSQHISLAVPRELIAPGEIGVVLLLIAPDPVTLLGASEAGLLAPEPEGALMTGAQYIEVSVLVSSDKGKTYTELDEARLIDHEIRLVMYDLSHDSPSIPSFMSHPTYVDSDPRTGIEILAEPGEWRYVSSMTLQLAPAAEDGTWPVSIEGIFTSLSVFAPFITDESMFDDSTDSTDEDADSDTGGDDTGTDGFVGTGDDGAGDTGSGDDDDGTVVTLEAESAGPCTSADVFVDFAYEGHELGTELKPYNTIDEGTQAVMLGGTIWIRPGGSNEAFVNPIVKPLFLKVWDEPSRQPGENVEICVKDMCQPDADSFFYEDFTSTIGVAPSGDAVLSGSGDTFLVIPEGTTQAGAVWTTEKKPVVRGFDVTIVVTLEDVPAFQDSDGFSFVIQNDSATPPLTTGGSMGYSDFANCLVVEYDGIQDAAQNDPSFDHFAVMRSAPGDNAVHDSAHELAVISIPEIYGRTVTAHIVYDPSAMTLTVDGVTLTNFDIEDYVTLDEGRAWIGVIGTSGTLSGGPTELQSWSADITEDPCDDDDPPPPPEGGGESTIWVSPIDWNSVGYAGDVFDHQILDLSLAEGTSIQEQIVYISDTFGGLSGPEIIEFQKNAGFWTVVFATKHGITGRWRNNNDGHWVNAGLYSTIQTYLAMVGDTGSILYRQDMKEVSSGRIYASHILTMKFVKIPQDDPCGYITLVPAHVFVEKSGAHNQDLWPNLPTVPCPP